MAALAAQPPAQAQSAQEGADNSATGSSAEPQTLGGITVTTQMREEHLLQDSGVRDIKDLQVLTPGLTVTPSAYVPGETCEARVASARVRDAGALSPS